MLKAVVPRFRAEGGATKDIECGCCSLPAPSARSVSRSACCSPRRGLGARSRYLLLARPHHRCGSSPARGPGIRQFGRAHRGIGRSRRLRGALPLATGGPGCNARREAADPDRQSLCRQSGSASLRRAANSHAARYCRHRRDRSGTLSKPCADRASRSRRRATSRLPTTRQCSAAIRSANMINSPTCRAARSSGMPCGWSSRRPPGRSSSMRIRPRYAAQRRAMARAQRLFRAARGRDQRRGTRCGRGHRRRLEHAGPFPASFGISSP